MEPLAAGVVLVGGALMALTYALYADPVPRIPIQRRQAAGGETRSALERFGDFLVSSADRILKSRGWSPFAAKDIELAGLRTSAASLVVVVVVMAFAAFLVGAVIGNNIVVGIVLAVLVPVSVKMFLRFKWGKRKRAFANQLDDTLQLLASALRAGHSLPRAFDTLSREAEAPMSEEIARIVNESRIGRDLVDAMIQTSERMDSQDFKWIARAVDIQRTTGGNLNEVLEQVGETIRERNEIQAKVYALCAEGRMSAYVLMGLPVFVGGMLTVMNPAYMAPLFTTGVGKGLIGASLVMFLIGGLWMRKVAEIKV